MNDLTTTAIFLVTGLVTAAGANREHPLLAKAKSQLLDEQYEAALFTAEQIIDHYPDTEYARAARQLMETIRELQLRRRGNGHDDSTNGRR